MVRGPLNCTDDRGSSACGFDGTESNEGPFFGGVMAANDEEEEQDGGDGDGEEVTTPLDVVVLDNVGEGEGEEEEGTGGDNGSVVSAFMRRVCIIRSHSERSCSETHWSWRVRIAESVDSSLSRHCVMLRDVSFFLILLFSVTRFIGYYYSTTRR